MTNSYKPGDRVVFTNQREGYPSTIHRNAPGTVVKLTSEAADVWLVKWDEKETPITVFGEAMSPQPVEAGCFVRWLVSGPDYLDISTRKVVRVFTPDPSWSNNEIVELESDRPEPYLVWLKDVVRVADPEPTPVSQPEPANFTVHDETDPTIAFVIENGCIYLNAITGFPVNSQINKLAEFITAHHSDKITESEGAADTAIRIMTDMRIALQEAALQLDERDETAKLVDKLGAFLIENKHVPETSPTIRNPVDDAIALINSFSERENVASNMVADLISKTNHAVDPNRLIGIRENILPRLDQLAAILERFVIKPTFKRGDLVVANFTNRIPIKGHITVIEQGRKSVELMNKFGQFFPNIPIDSLTFARD